MTCSWRRIAPGAAGKGWNDSALTAILRNTSYLLIRRNLTRNESRYMLISGATYGWHQWGATVAMAGLGLQDPAMQADVLRGLYWRRLNYEDNAQWYLIVSALVARSGFAPDTAMCRRCLEFMRDNDKNGAFVPPERQAGS